MLMFISGPITGVDDYFEKFKQAEAVVREMGHVPVNPAAVAQPLLDAGVEFRHDQWMAIDLALLAQCDAVYHLNGWENSEGAKMEHLYALENNIQIYYQNNSH